MAATAAAAARAAKDRRSFARAGRKPGTVGSRRIGRLILRRHREEDFAPACDPAMSIRVGPVVMDELGSPVGDVGSQPCDPLQVVVVPVAGRHSLFPVKGRRVWRSRKGRTPAVCRRRRRDIRSRRRRIVLARNRLREGRTRRSTRPFSGRSPAGDRRSVRTAVRGRPPVRKDADVAVHDGIGGPHAISTARSRQETEQAPLWPFGAVCTTRK
jgi:hypothetical protein